jgi:hypothetical protein
MAAGSNTIVVKVGPDGKEYNLHTGLLIHHSGYFLAHLEKPMTAWFHSSTLTPMPSLCLLIGRTKAL